jgi:hypothetical protein
LYKKKTLDEQKNPDVEKEYRRGKHFRCEKGLLRGRINLMRQRFQTWKRLQMRKGTTNKEIILNVERS